MGFGRIATEPECREPNKGKARRNRDKREKKEATNKEF
jgi:hypothetical protein